MKGRPPKPAEQKRREGNPGKRPIGDPVLVGDRLVADADTELLPAVGEVPEGAVVIGERVYLPEHLPPLPEHLELDDDERERAAARKVWNEITALLIDAQLLTRGDLLMVSMLVENILEARRAWRALREHGSVVQTANPYADRSSYKASPYHKIWRDANAEVRKLAEHFALTPVARARLGLAIGKGRKIQQELDTGLPENPRDTRGDVDGSATELDIYDDD